MNKRYTWTTKKMETVLARNGYKLNRQKGDHSIWTKPGCNHISINKKLNQMVAQRLVKENGLVV